MRKYPIGIQDFKKLREGGYLYVDKTREIYDLLEAGSYYFLSRPRRFGKSLLLSTIKYLFEGERDLFNGLWIAENADFDWTPHPVLHFSFSTLSYKDLGLEAALHQALDLKAAEHGFSLTRKGLGQRFQELLQNIGGNGQKVVLLIDEYDKPLVDYIDQKEKAAENRDTLKNLFSVIKDSDMYLRFFLITGVSKFSKVSLFSDLNHLRDITLLKQYASIVGYTQEELDSYFDVDFEALAQEEGSTVEIVREKVKRWYNGYRWGDTTTLYNPFSILNFFASKKFANYWWETGTPTFLINMLREGFHYEMKEIEAGEILFDSYTLDNMDWKSLMFQTGYLTILKYEEEYQLYTLGYPNVEVKNSMQQYLMASFAHRGRSDSQALFAHLKRAIDKHDLPRFIEVVNTLFASIPYQLFIADQERFFHAILHLSFSGLGMISQSEVSTAKGRVDTIIQTKTHIYIIEFKLDESVASAFNQIRDKRYGSPYLGQGKEVIAIGVAFSSATKEVSDWKAVPYEALLVEG